MQLNFLRGRTITEGAKLIFAVAAFQIDTRRKITLLFCVWERERECVDYVVYRNRYFLSLILWSCCSLRYRRKREKSSFSVYLCCCLKKFRTQSCDVQGSQTVTFSVSIEQSETNTNIQWRHFINFPSEKRDSDGFVLLFLDWASFWAFCAPWTSNA